MKKIAYCIMVHNDVEHLKSLIKALGDNCEIFIHVDGYVDDKPFIDQIIASNVHFLQPRIRVSWAGISMVDVMIELLRMALSFSENFSHYVFLSGSCYPIKSNEIIHNFLTSNSKTSFIKYIDARKDPNFEKQIKYNYWMENPFKVRNRLTHQTTRILRRLSILIRSKNNRWRKNIVPYHGSNWVAINLECANYILKFNDENPWFREMFKYTYAPDEHYFHTILGNSPLSQQCTGLQDFQYFGLDYLSNLHIIHISLTKWYTIDDLEEIVSSEKLFVRKVRSFDGKKLIQKINEKKLSVNENS